MKQPTRAPRGPSIALAFALAVPALAGCGGKETTPKTPVATIPRRAPLLAGGIGSVCSSDRDCAATAACFDGEHGDGTCLCRPGLVACGSACVDPARDPQNCGGCNRACAPGAACNLGVCGPLPAPPPLASVGVTPYDPSTCTRATELFPESSVNPTPMTFGVTNFFQRGAPDAVLSTTQELAAEWSRQTHKPRMGEGLCGTSDPWATTSGYTGLEYVSFRTVACQVKDGGCVGIGATQSQSLPQNGWSYPVTCFNPINEADDGPAIHFDISGTTLWAAAPAPPRWEYYLYAAPDCRTGQPGGPECPLADLSPADPRTPALNVSGSNGANNTIDGHPDIAVNPCTHHAIATYRTGNRDRVDAGTIKMSFVTPTGVLKSTYTVARVGPFSSNDQCSGGGTCTKGYVCKCGGGNATGECTGSEMSCLRIVPRAQVVTKFDAEANRCLAYVSYDYVDKGVSPRRFRSALHVIDVTDEAHPRNLRTLTTSAPPGGQTFNSIPTVSAYTRGAGWFFYLDDGSHCQTSFTGYVDTNLFLATQRPLLLTPQPFPTFGGTVVVGDYVAAIRRGLPGGYLFPTWNEPVPGPGQCTKCLGRGWNTRVVGAPVLP